MNNIITFLYLCNAGVATFAYVPQCMSLWKMLKSGNVNKSVSLATWLMWSWACSVTFFYAFFVNGEDFAFMAISAVNVIFCLLTAWLTFLVHQRS